MVFDASVLVLVAVHAEELPVAAVRRVVIVIAVLVMDGELAQARAGECARAAAADVREELEGLLAVVGAAHGGILPRGPRAAGGSRRARLLRTATAEAWVRRPAAAW